MWQAGLGIVAGASAALLLAAWIPTPVFAIGCVVLAATGLLLRRPWIGACAAGGLLCLWQLDARLADRLDPGLEGQSLAVRGRVVSVPLGALPNVRFRFAPDRVAGQTRVPRLVELTWYDAPSRPQAAEDLELVVKLRRPRGFANPGGHDLEARMLRDGVGASGYVRSGRRLGRQRDAHWRHAVLIARAHVADRVRSVLGERPAAGIVTGLAVGLQDALSREQWLALSRSGTSHLMAISGLHIAMVAAMAAWAGSVLQRLRQRRGATGARRDAAALAGVVAALVYSALAGWSIPTQRTMVMIAAGALALLARRRCGVADGLALCAAAVVLLDPLAPLAPGFWLSFGAVAAILFGASGHVLRAAWWHGYLRIQCVVTLGLLPALVGSFGAVSLVAAGVNLLAIPLYTLCIVPLVLVSCAAESAWPAAGAVLLRLTGNLIEATWPLIEVPAAWPMATWPVAGLDPVAWLALVAGTVAAMTPLPGSGRAAGLCLIAVACTWRPVPVGEGAARVTVLDVGQGLAAVVETHRHVLVYDTGPAFRTGSDTGQLVVVPYLQHRGVRTIDRLVVSHDDGDHKGGAASLLGLLPTQELVTGPGVDVRALAAPRQLRVSLCRRGESWNWDGVDFEWLHPGPQDYVRDNDGSCVLRVRAGEQDLLLPGDVEARAEADMLDAAQLSASTIVVAPHHGSRTSSTPSFVAATRPQWIVYAAGHRNRWHFPVTAIVERWERAGARGLTTSASGAITFTLRPGEALAGPGQWRLEMPPPWRDP